MGMVPEEESASTKAWRECSAGQTLVTLYSIRLEGNPHSGEWEKGVHMAKLGMNHEDPEFLLNTMKSI